jgi:radical SAM protein with 4Fe4S-binding SPASM domain
MKPGDFLNLQNLRMLLREKGKQRGKCRSDGVPLPKILEIEPTNTCNLRCKMCHVSFLDCGQASHLRPDLLHNLKFMEGSWVKIGSNFEPTMHPHFSDILAIFSDIGCLIDLTTNGTLLTDRLTDQIAESTIRNVTISFDSARKATYERIRRGAKFELALERILRCRERLREENVFFAINAVLCRSNIDELIEMVDFWNSHDFHQLRWIFMVIRSLDQQRWGKDSLLEESLYPIRQVAFRKLDDAAEYLITNNLKMTLSCPYYNWSRLRKHYPDNISQNLVKSDNPLGKDYFNPAHHYQRGNYPGMKVDCRSPFVFARILFNGDVQLCYKYSIGNLEDQTFHDIWNGKKADRIRRAVLRNGNMCKLCDYYRFCLNSTRIDVNDKSNYFEGALLDRSKDEWANESPFIPVKD